MAIYLYMEEMFDGVGGGTNICWLEKGHKDFFATYNRPHMNYYNIQKSGTIIST